MEITHHTHKAFSLLCELSILQNSASFCDEKYMSKYSFLPWFGKVDPVGQNNWWPGLMTQGNHWPQRALLRQKLCPINIQ